MSEVVYRFHDTSDKAWRIVGGINNNDNFSPLEGQARIEALRRVVRPENVTQRSNGWTDYTVDEPSEDHSAHGRPFSADAKPPTPVVAHNPRPGQTWRVNGREGVMVDVERDILSGDTVYRFRMVDRDRVELTIAERQRLADVATFLRGPTEPETPREEWERVCALMLADRPNGASEVVWRAVVAGIGERVPAGDRRTEWLRARCDDARFVFATAERAKAWTR